MLTLAGAEAVSPAEGDPDDQPLEQHNTPEHANNGPLLAPRSPISFCGPVTANSEVVRACSAKAARKRRQKWGYFVNGI